MRLLALDEGPDIPIAKAMILVGRHPACDARLDSGRVSRRHCCLTPVGDELEVRDLDSTNGIRINGERVRSGRLRAGDGLWIAHLRYQLDGGQGPERTRADEVGPEHTEGGGRDAISGGPPAERDPSGGAHHGLEACAGSYGNESIRRSLAPAGRCR
jgi:hypothetical protein